MSSKGAFKPNIFSLCSCTFLLSSLLDAFNNSHYHLGKEQALKMTKQTTGVQKENKNQNSQRES